MNVYLKLLFGLLIYAYFSFALWSVGHDLRLITSWTPCDILCMFLFAAWAAAEVKLDSIKNKKP